MRTVKIATQLSVLFIIVLGIYLLTHGTKKSPLEEYKWCRDAAERGDLNAQSNLGVMYENGYGVEKDYQEALKWYRTAARRGNAVAQKNLGTMYANGFGVDKDAGEAYVWLNLSAANGDAQGGEIRDLVEKTMSPSQVSDAQKRTVELKKQVAEKMWEAPPK
jgi:hypothetical protein